ncbi:serine hydrolase domain-containing protein [Streptomyces filamentosus]|uniref:serine hydrolase domain-containing protein n=1 Tax=Streptomyces filamentosus TaxID=67294 RepID=UPI00123840F6|nr:serine hydrolase domain-containing protein [Streptomyces filamentosus]KAA6215705.1 class A beta-lactamase-related serine hydrolase [Streptomyces filamentosus]
MADLQAQVESVLGSLVDSGRETGAQAAAYLHGELIVDARAGDGVGPDSLFHSFSTGKGVTATLVHVLAERGLLDPDAPISAYWPEFGAHGKDRATVRDALVHRTGVPQLPPAVTAEELFDFDGMAALVAAQEPLWEPGTATGYHGWTFGWILGELVRRVTGLSVAEALRTHVAEPLGIADSLLYGVPEEQAHRVVPLVAGSWEERLAEIPPEAPFFLALPHRGVWPAAALANRPDYLRADLPAAATLSARAAARMYAALLGEVDGVRLLPAEALPRLYALQTAEPDRILGAPVAKGMGYFLDLPAMGGEPAFGHNGSGGSVAFADHRRGLSFAFTHSRLTGGPESTAAVELAAVVRAAVDRAERNARGTVPR